jgi:hypothetical protein
MTADQKLSRAGAKYVNYFYSWPSFKAWIFYLPGSAFICGRSLLIANSQLLTATKESA